MLSRVKKIARKYLQYNRQFKGRHILALSDLKRKYENVTKPITLEQRNKIEDFWTPYVKGRFIGILYTKRSLSEFHLSLMRRFRL